MTQSMSFVTSDKNRRQGSKNGNEGHTSQNRTQAACDHSIQRGTARYLETRLQIPDSFSHLDMTGRGQAAEPLTVSLSSLAAVLQKQHLPVCLPCISF